MKYKSQDALQVAEKLIQELKLACTQIEISGALAMGAKSVDHVEIHYKPILEWRRLGPFGQQQVNLVDEKIAWLTRNNMLERSSGSLLHKATRIPIRMFNQNAKY